PLQSREERLWRSLTRERFCYFASAFWAFTNSVPSASALSASPSRANARLMSASLSTTLRKRFLRYVHKVGMLVSYQQDSYMCGDNPQIMRKPVCTRCG